MGEDFFLPIPSVAGRLPRASCAGIDEFYGSFPLLVPLAILGVRGKDGHNAAVVPLEEGGVPREPRPVTLDRSYAYLATDRAGRFLLGRDYGSGAVDVYPLGAAGRLRSPASRLPPAAATRLFQRRARAWRLGLPTSR